MGGRRVSLNQPRRGQDLSRLTAHGPEETPLQHAATKLAGLIAPPHLAIDDDRPAARPVNEHSLRDYVGASLGMAHDETRIDPTLAPYLDELSKAASTGWGIQPVTESSFRLLCILYMADQVPGPAVYGQFRPDAFMGWLSQQLPPGTAVPHDCIPERYFDGVQVGRNPETAFTNRCAVRFGPDLAHSVDVRALHRADLRGANLQGADLRGADMRGAVLWGANLQGADLLGTNLQGADLRGAKLEGADLTGVVLDGAILEGVKLEGAHLQRAHLRAADLRGADLEGAKLEGALLDGANLRRANLGRAKLLNASLRDADLYSAYLWEAALCGADLRGADLGFAYLAGADLQRANLVGADLQRANLRFARLQGADLRAVNLEGAHLHGADLEGAHLEGAKLP